MLPALRVVLLVALLAGCSAGTKPGTGAAQQPPAEVQHGSVEELLSVLERRGTPCRDARPMQQLPRIAEEAVECALAPGGELVRLVHFRDVAGAREFEAAIRAGDGHGVYADTWGATTATEEVADRLAQALASRGSS